MENGDLDVDFLVKLRVKARLKELGIKVDDPSLSGSVEPPTAPPIPDLGIPDDIQGNTLAEFKCWQRGPTGEILIWNGFSGTWESLQKARSIRPKDNTKTGKAEEVRQTTKQYRLSAEGRRVSNLIGCLVKVYHLARWNDWKNSEVLERVKPLLPLVGGRDGGNALCAEFRKDCRKRLHVGGGDAVKRVVEDEQGLAALVLGKAYGNAVKVKKDEYAIRFAKKYVTAYQKYSKRPLAPREVREKINQSLKRFAKRQNKDPENIELYYKFGAQVRISRCARAAFNYKTDAAELSAFLETDGEGTSDEEI
ncbi:hypothetical protein EG329_008880 [Mollisiaceae sp. DMI_Dod_QoI]|nr:hypothetical protein EG329_008880 [Helotiales sp. DMI_Dod_QoI]